ncbi:MAG TPA: hypothetical protein VE597_07230, partial [Geminicoccaceae bacterium]|nr:hypothetical protein [Geminicoccaceae bacterium]
RPDATTAPAGLIATSQATTEGARAVLVSPASRACQAQTAQPDVNATSWMDSGRTDLRPDSRERL